MRLFFLFFFTYKIVVGLRNYRKDNIGLVVSHLVHDQEVGGSNLSAAIFFTKVATTLTRLIF